VGQWGVDALDLAAETEVGWGGGELTMSTWPWRHLTGQRGIDALADRGGVRRRRGGTAPVQRPLHLLPAAIFTDGGETLKN
jgi:hypothetical protein